MKPAASSCTRLKQPGAGLGRRPSSRLRLRVQSAAAVRVALDEKIDVYYRTNWNTSKLHGSLGGGAWQDFPLTPVISSSGRWHHASIPVTKIDPTAPLLEFVVTDGNGNWDKPTSGGNFKILGQGKFTLRHGEINRVAPSPPAVLVVSDLDGTMVGDDGATEQFKRFWEDAAVVRGGVLAYNTGRSLDSFENLLREKGHCLAHPDVLISAVGTKIYNFTNNRWVEDLGWVLQLEQGWSLDVVRQAAYAALGQVGKEKMHFRPPEEQNDHKVTCGVHVNALDSVVASISAALQAATVEANIIVSGTGDWRFMDLVSKQAGKLEALNYVRVQRGFPLERTVACGDSGNDILMLSGQNLALVVANAQPDLKKWVAAEQQAGGADGPGGRQRLWVSNKHEALGILEGLEYWGLK